MREREETWRQYAERMMGELIVPWLIGLGVICVLILIIGETIYIAAGFFQ